MLNPAPLSLHKPIPKETPRAARAFHDYCLMGSDRSLRKLAEQRDKTGTKAGQIFKQLGRWSSFYHWQDRVKEYDAAQAEERRRKREAELDRMDEEHALIGRTQLLRAVQLVQHHIDTNDTTLAGAVSLMKASYELQRIALGAATARIEGDIAIALFPKEYINLSDEEEGSE